MNSRIIFPLVSIAMFAVWLSAIAAPPAGYYLVWSDEFNSTSLDATKWDYWLLGNRRDAVNVTNAVSVGGGNLVITTYTTNGTHYTGMIATDGTFRSRYGYWESSIKWGDTNGMWSAYWMQSPTMGTYLNDPAVSGSELDIVEHRYTDGSANIANQVQNNIHWNGYGGSAASAGSGNIGSGLASGFHTYGFLWTPAVYTLYVDGSNLRSWNTANNGVPISQSTEWAILSSEVDDTSTTWAGTIPSGGYGNLGTSTTKLTADYVRYYAPTTTLFWTGASSVYLTNSANFISNMPPLTTSDLTFSMLSGNNLSPLLGGDLSVDSLVFLNINNGATIGGTNMLTIGAGGVDMVSANHSVTISCPVTIGAAQTWLVGPNNPGNTLNLSGNLSGVNTLGKGGYGILILNGTNSFSGTLNVDTGSTTANDGALRITRNANIANVPSPISIRNNNGGSSILQLDGTLGSVTISQNISLAGRNTNIVSIENVAGSNTISGNITLQSGGGNYWIQSDGGTLNLSGLLPAGSPTTARTLTFMGSGNILVSGVITNGSAGTSVSLVKSGAGTLTLNNLGAYSGTNFLVQGIVQVNANNAFGTGFIDCNSGASTARIVLGNNVTITNRIIADTVNSGAALGMLMVNDNSSATFSGPVTFNANATAGGHIAGPTTSGLLSFTGPISATNAGTFIIVRFGNTRYSGGGSYPEIQFRANTSSLGAANGIATNAVVDIGGNGSTTTPTMLDLNGFNQTLAGLKNAVTPANVAWVTNSAAITNMLTLNLGATNFSFGGSILGRIALTLNSGTQTLAKTGSSAVNGLYTLSGDTTLNGGSLILASGITLPNTPVITVGAGATFDVSVSGFTLTSAQTIKGNGAVLGDFTANGIVSPGLSIGTLTFSNSLTLAGTTLIELDESAHTNDVIRCSGTVNYGGTLSVTNLGGTLGVGDSFKIIYAANYNGSFASLNLPPLGTGLAWNTNNLATNGMLSVVLGAVAPHTTQLSLAGTNFVFSGSGGAAGYIYSVLSTTNLALPLTNWNVIDTRTFDTNGAFIFSNGIDPQSSQQYYEIQIQ